MGSVIVGCISQKGGSGKTAVASALGACLRRRGHLTAMLDIDPQHCLSLVSAGVENVDVGNLASALRRLAAWDFVIIDTAPSLEQAKIVSELADALVIPTRLTYVDLRGLGNLLAVVDNAKIVAVAAVGARLHVKHCRTVLEKIEGLSLGRPIVPIPFSIASADAAALGTDLATYAPAKARGVSQAYDRLCSEVEKWRKSRR